MKIELTGNRRSFLKGAAILGGVTLSLLLGRKRSTAAPVKNNPPAKESNGARYRLTAHIKKYYETANL